MEKILLLMRKGCAVHGENIAQIRRLGFQIIAVTGKHDPQDMSRFHAVEYLPDQFAIDLVAQTIAIAQKHVVLCAVTFQETDIVLCAEINAALGVPAASPSAARICRDKSLQRALLLSAGIASVHFVGVSNMNDALEAAKKIGYPVILKPTRAAASMNVCLVHDDITLREEASKIESLAQSGKGLYFEKDAAIADTMIVEEYLPGTEVTLDGVVVKAHLHLGGIHNKMDMNGPYFEEDLYSLPYKEPEVEKSLEAIAAKICSALGLENSLFNAELRRSREGEFRVIEFSCRPTGGRAYRDIFDVYGIDLVSAHIASLAPLLADRLSGFLQRLPAQTATCMKLVYGNGKVLSNTAGEAKVHPGFTDYYPLVPIGTNIQSAPLGFDIAALLCVNTMYMSSTDPSDAEQLAVDLYQQISFKTET